MLFQYHDEDFHNNMLDLLGKYLEIGIWSLICSKVTQDNKQVNNLSIFNQNISKCPQGTSCQIAHPKFLPKITIHLAHDTT